MTVLTARAGMSALFCASLFGYAAAGAAAELVSGKALLSGRDEHHYAVTLESSSAADIKPSKPLPKAFEDFRLYRTSLIRDGKKIYAVRIGFFATEAKAEAARKQLAVTFPNAKVVEIGARERDEVLAASRPPALGPKKPMRVADARHYAVNLATLFKPPLVGDIAKDFPQRVVYAAQTSVFDEEFYFLRVGFFSTFFEAEMVRQAARAKYPAAAVRVVSEAEYRQAMKLPPVPEPPVEPVRKDIPPPAPREERHYAVTLESSAAADVKPSKPLPKAFQDLPLYRTSIVQDGKKVHVVRLGFFTTEAEAESARKQLAAVFPNAKVAQVAAPERDEALRVTRAAELKRRLQTEPRRPEPPKIAAPSAGPDAERGADALMQAGREAFTAERYKTAVDVFSKILAMPPNAQSKDALEFRGLAYERLGETDRAGVDYNAYLDRHPQGEDAERMRQRLSNLEPPPEPEPLKEVKRQEDAQTQIFGGLSQYYYKGNSKIETQDTAPVNPTPGQTLSLTDQKALITTIDLNVRSRSPTTDSRWVFRDTASYNFLPNGDDRNRVTAAYYDYKYKPADFAARLGRQPGSGNGVLGRFDGVTTSYGIAPRWRIGAVAGTPVDSSSLDVDRTFTGVYGELGPFGSWSGNVYVIRQDADGMTDRKAVGTELRYFDPQRSVFSVLDYDVYFGELNIALVQGSWTTPENTVYSFVLDRRKAPLLQSTTALQGFNTSLESLRQTLSEDEIKRRAQGLTAVSELASLGVTVPFSAKWQLGGDVRLSRTSGTEGAPAIGGTGEVLATQPTGNSYTYTAQAIGTGLLGQRDVSVLSVSLIDDPINDALLYSLTSRTPIGERWSLDVVMIYYSGETNTNATTDRFSPTLRVGYRWRDNIAFEAELGVEKTKTDNPVAQTTEESKRNYFSLGYRWDF